MQVLKEKGADFDFERILVEVYPQLPHMDEATHAQEIFLEVNKAEPVKLVDLPGVAKASHRSIINEGAKRLSERFPEMFSSSQRCRAPHMNIDNLRDALFASNVIDRHSLKSPSRGKNHFEWPFPKFFPAPSSCVVLAEILRPVLHFAP